MPAEPSTDTCRPASANGPAQLAIASSTTVRTSAIAGVRSVWRASARRLVIVEPSRSSATKLSRSTSAVSGRGASSSASIAMRMAATGAVRKFFAENRSEFDPRKWLAASTRSMKEICKSRYEAFGAAGNASKIKPLSFDAMTRQYGVGI